MRKIFCFFIFIIFYVFLFIEVVFSSPLIEQNFLEANKEYKNGNYKKAIDIYEQLLSEKIYGTNIYYNLANSYFKLKQYGKAILNYERALKLNPKDEDSFANYNLVKSILEIQDIKKEYTWNEHIYIFIKGIFTTKGWFFCFFTFFVFLCICLGICIYYPHFFKNFYIVFICLGILLIFSLFFFLRSNFFDKNNKMGIIIVPKIEVRYSPSYSGAIAFELTEGIKTQIINKHEKWIQIRLNRKNSGWIDSSAIEEI